MTGDDGHSKPPAQESLDQLVPESSVREIKIETEAVALARLNNENAKEKNEHTKFVLVVVVATLLLVVSAGFLIYAYTRPETGTDMQGKILLGFVSGLSGAVGVLLGKKF